MIEIYIYLFILGFTDVALRKNNPVKKLSFFLNY